MHTQQELTRGESEHARTNLYGLVWILHVLQDFSAFIAGEVARKLRQGCLLGLKVSDSDGDDLTVIFR
jgi:hypothetical protein